MSAEELEIKITENIPPFNRIFFDFTNAPTKKQGYAVIEIRTLDPETLPRNHVNCLADRIGIGGTYTWIYQFYPNGRRCDKSELRQGRGTNLLNRIFEYSIAHRQRFVFCTSDKGRMCSFLISKGFEELKEGYYLKELKIK